MGRKIDLSRYSRAAESVGPEDLKGKKYGVGTIVEFGEYSREDDSIAPNIKLKEFVGESGNPKVLWLNQTMLKYLLGEFGNDVDGWEGKRIALEVRRTRDVSSGQEKPKVYVANPEDWADIFKAAKGGKK